MQYRIPRDAIHGSSMARQNGNWYFLFHMPYVDFVVFTAAGYKVLVNTWRKKKLDKRNFLKCSATPETAVDCKMALGDALELSH